MATVLAFKPDRAPEIREEEIRREVSSAIVVDFGRGKEADNCVMEITGATHRAVKDWRAENTAMQVKNFLKLAQKSPSLKAYVRHLLQMETDMDPHFEREFVQLVQRFQKMKEPAA